ncbi:MAG: N-carbamoyl-D-amino-acid hydrolase, partial [Phreatobacter sp.]|nr:N-carbamoyl-D-amino-acid hydrolase [Phreatobacter sp.]
DDGVLVIPCDLDETTFGKDTIFDFKRHRRVEHYGLITERVGVGEPLGR